MSDAQPLAPPPGFQPMAGAPLDRPVGIVSRDPFEPDADHVAPAIWRDDWQGWVLAEDRDALCHPPHGWREIAAGTLWGAPM